MSEQREVVVVGGGIAGLTAGHALRDRDVVVLEAADRVGGRIRSEPRGDNWLNFGAHVFGGESSVTGGLLTELGVRAEPVPGRLAAVSLNGKLVSSGPVESFPFRLPMPARSRVALVRTGLKLRLAVRRYAEIAAPREGEDPAERQRRMLEFMDDRSFSDFAGTMPEDVDLLFRSTLTRSSGEPEELAAGYGVGYFHLVWDKKGGLSRNILGGSAVFTDALAAALGDRVRTGARVTRVEARGDGVRVKVEGGDTDRRACRRRRDARVRHARDRCAAPRGHRGRARSDPVRPLRRLRRPHERDRSACSGTISTRSRRRGARSAC